LTYYIYDSAHPNSDAAKLLRKEKYVIFFLAYKLLRICLTVVVISSNQVVEMSINKMRNLRNMKNMKNTMLAVALAGTLGFSGASMARGTSEGAIEKITTSGNVTNIFMVEPSVAISGESRPSCAIRTDFFTLSVDQKNQLALVLTAFALGNDIEIKGSDSCTNKSNAEDIAVIQLLAQ
jgi:hypothetical protein